MRLHIPYDINCKGECVYTHRDISTRGRRQAKMWIMIGPW